MLLWFLRGIWSNIVVTSKVVPMYLVILLTKKEERRLEVDKPSLCIRTFASNSGHSPPNE